VFNVNKNLGLWATGAYNKQNNKSLINSTFFVDSKMQSKDATL
jgi:hypothetical protein